MPGSTPATSQLDWLISTTAITVLSWSKATRDLLKSFGWGIRALHQLDAATMVPSPRRLPHTISPQEEAGFEPKSVAERIDANDWAFRASRCRRGSVARTRCTELTVEGDRGFESCSLQRRVMWEPHAVHVNGA